MFIHTKNVVKYVSMGGSICGLKGIRKISLSQSDLTSLISMIECNKERALLYLKNLEYKMTHELHGKKADTIIIDDVEEV